MIENPKEKISKLEKEIKETREAMGLNKGIKKDLKKIAKYSLFPLGYVGIRLMLPASDFVLDELVATGALGVGLAGEFFGLVGQPIVSAMNYIEEKKLAKLENEKNVYLEAFKRY